MSLAATHAAAGELPVLGSTGTFVPVRVVGVPHGSMVTVMTLTEHREIYDVVLAQIEAPDVGQPYGDVSKEVLGRKVFGTEGEVLVLAQEGSRWMGQLIIGGGDINLFMVLNGLAWADGSASDPRYADAMADARAAKRGLWAADEVPVPPWQFRKRQKVPSSPQISGAMEGDT